MDYQTILEKQEYGCVEAYGKTIVIAQQPYLSDGVPYDASYEDITYEALGIDEDFNEYLITWNVTDENFNTPEALEEEDACDWEDYKVRKY
jgi:hypothetical protein